MKKIFNRIQYLVIYFLLFLPLGIVCAKVGDPVVITTTLVNPIEADSFQKLVEAVLKVVIAIGTPIAILAIIYCGFLFVKARGNPEELKTAKTALIWTIVGVAVLLGAQLLSMVVKGTIEGLGAGV